MLICIHEIYDSETVHNVSDYSKEEMNKFIESLTSDHFAKIQKFFNTMPRLQHELEIENPKTKVKSKVVLSEATKFFRIALSHDNLENLFSVKLCFNATS